MTAHGTTDTAIEAMKRGAYEYLLKPVKLNELRQIVVPVIAATNQNLEQLIDEGRFRQDLYCRLKVFTIELSPLRDRLEDLPDLLDHFIKVYNRELGKQIQSASAGIVEMLAAYPWHGNIRELQSTVKYALVHAHGNVLTPECFPESCRSGSAVDRDSEPSTAVVHHLAIGATCPPTETFDIGQRFAELLEQGHTDAYHLIENEVDRYLLTEALRLAHGNQVEASRLLGISRTTLRAILDSLGLSIEKHVQPNADHHDQTLNS